MYRLLIVTDDTLAMERLAGMDGWETMGFKPPLMLSDPEAAKERLGKHHVDAIAIQDGPAYQALYDYLDQTHPDMPLFEIAQSEEEQREVIRQLYRLLVRVNADDSNDEYDEISRMQQIREKWLKKVIGGLMPSQKEMYRQARLYRCREPLDVPCVLARLQLPGDDNFLSERWHYGSDRLEVALRNFFGHEHGNMRMHVAVISPEEVRVLCCPVSPEEGLSENGAFEYVQETLDQVDNYLGLRMKVLEMCRVTGLSAFAGGCPQD